MKIEEEVPINNASSGNIQGIGGEPSDPPVSKKLQNLTKIVRRIWSQKKKYKSF